MKFADADLIGLPYQVVVGKRGLAEGVVELKDRATGERDTVPIAALVERLAAKVREDPARGSLVAPQPSRPSAGLARLDLGTPSARISDATPP